MTKRKVPVNELNQPLGEAHPRAEIPDAVVVEMRDLHERHNLTIREVARRLGRNFWTTREICLYRRRLMVYREWRTVEDEKDGE